MSKKRAILFQAVLCGYALTAGMYILCDQHLSWRGAFLGLADLAVAGVNIWLAERTFDQLCEEMARACNDLVEREKAK